MRNVFLGGNRRLTILLSCSLLLESLTDAALPITIPLVTWYALEAAKRADETYIWGGIVVAAISLLATTMSFVSQYTTSIIVLRICANIKVNLVRNMQQKSLSWHLQTHTGDVFSAINTDVDSIQSLLNNELSYLIGMVVTGVSACVTSAVLNWRITFIGLVFVIPAIFISKLGSMRVFSLTQTVQQGLATLVRHVMDGLSGATEIRILQVAETFIERFIKSTHIIRDAYSAREKWNGGLTAFSILIESVSFTVIMVLGLWMFRHGLVSIGSVTAIALLQATIANSITEIIRGRVYLAQFRAVVDHIYEVVGELEQDDYPISVNDTLKSMNQEYMAQSATYLRIQRLSFQYQSVDGAPSILDQVSFDVRQGELVAIVGPSGGGKSTLLRVIAGLLFPMTGSILLNQTILSPSTINEYRRNVSYVPQSPRIFHGTLRDNIRLGSPNAKNEDVLEAARLAGVDQFAESLPQGYDTLQEHAGDQVSGGQRQRIALARAFLKDAPVLLMDEPSSALDLITEQHIKLTMERLRAQGKIIIVATHQTSIVNNADARYVMDNGRLSKA